MSQQATCPHCGKAVQADWAFCPFCGQSARAETGAAAAASAAPLLPEPPEPESISGPCAILSTRLLPRDISGPGYTLSRMLRRPLADMTATMSLSKGILARGVDAATAREIKKAVEGPALPIVLIPEDQFIAAPPLRLLRGAEISAAGVRGHVMDDAGVRRDAWIAAPVLLIAAIRVRWESRELSVAETAAQAEVRQWMEGSVFGRLATARLFWRRKREPEPVLRVRHRYVISLFPRSLEARYDLAEQEPDLAQVQAVAESFERAVEQARALRRLAPAVPTNSGLQLLLEERREQGWEELTFLSRSAASAYYEWLLQLAARGYELPL